MLERKDEGTGAQALGLSDLSTTLTSFVATSWFLSTTMTEEVMVFLDIHMGNREDHAKEQAEYDATTSLLTKNAAIYGLPTTPAELTEEQQQILAELDVLTS